MSQALEDAGRRPVSARARLRMLVALAAASGLGAAATPWRALPLGMGVVGWPSEPTNPWSRPTSSPIRASTIQPPSEPASSQPVRAGAGPALLRDGRVIVHSALGRGGSDIRCRGSGVGTALLRPRCHRPRQCPALRRSAGRAGAAAGSLAPAPEVQEASAARIAMTHDEAASSWPPSSGPGGNRHRAAAALSGRFHQVRSQLDAMETTLAASLTNSGHDLDDLGSCRPPVPLRKGVPRARGCASAWTACSQDGWRLLSERPSYRIMQEGLTKHH